jgi:hypothetical protein
VLSESEGKSISPKSVIKIVSQAHATEYWMISAVSSQAKVRFFAARSPAMWRWSSES